MVSNFLWIPFLMGYSCFFFLATFILKRLERKDKSMEPFTIAGCLPPTIIYLKDSFITDSIIISIAYHLKRKIMKYINFPQIEQKL